MAGPKRGKTTTGHAGLTPAAGPVTYTLHFRPPDHGVTKVGSGRAHFFFFRNMTAIGSEDIAGRARALLEPILVRDGYELVEVEWLRQGSGWVLRLFIDRPGGIGVDDCQQASRTVDPILDVEDLIDVPYHLEVSSPGLDRPLRRPGDFDRFAGRRVKVKTHGAVETGSGPRKSWTGTLRGYRDGMVEVDVDGRLHRIPHDQIARARLEYDLEAHSRRKE